MADTASGSCMVRNQYIDLVGRWSLFSVTYDESGRRVRRRRTKIGKDRSRICFRGVGWVSGGLRGTSVLTVPRPRKLSCYF